jgi:hypothetical protein
MSRFFPEEKMAGPGKKFANRGKIDNLVRK